MSLFPAGRRRTMFAQTYITPESSDLGINSGDIQPDNFESNSSVDEPEGLAYNANNQSNQAVQDVAVNTDLDQGQDESSSNNVGKAKGKPSLTKTVFDFLVDKAGYPPRRLHEFKSQFYDETGSKGGDTQVTVTLPDYMYGTDEQISNDSLKELINTIEQQFGLSYVDYKRSNLQTILNFSSTDPRKQEMEDNEPGDILDQVYRSSNNKQAKSFNDLLKESKNNMVKMLRGEI